MLNTKEFKISHGWTLVVHEDVTIYSKIDGPNPNQYLLLDWDGDLFLQVFTDDLSIYLEPSMYGLKQRINAKNKIATIFHEPDHDDDE